MRFFHRLAVLATGLSCARRIDAQATTSAVCTQDLWTFNSQGVSPCLVASALEGACHAGVWNINPLLPNSVYGGPYQGQSDKCQCSSVVYSIVSACGACQGGSTTTWSLWIANCSQSDISVSSYPLTIPLGITVPAWAYLNVTTKGIWDPTDALNSHNSGAPDSSAITPTATGTGTGAPAASVTPTGSSGASSPASSNSSSSGSSTNAGAIAGAIAGGVVGGVVGVALVALGAFLFVRRRRRANAVPASAQFQGNGTRGEMVNLVGQSPVVGGFQNPPPFQMQMQMEPPRLYDPSDPSTFPASPSPSLPAYPLSTSPVPSAPYSQVSGLYSQTSAPYSSVSAAVPISPTATATYSHASGYGHAHQTSQSSQGYSGVPEV